MGSRILLISTNEYDFPCPVFPLGLAHVESALQRDGHETRLIDFNLDPPPVSAQVREFHPDVVGISVRNIDDALIQRRQTFFDGLNELCQDIRENSRAVIVLGGSGFSIFPEALLDRSGADFGIQGEGEGQFNSLIDALANGGDLSQISGLVYRSDGEIKVNPRSCVEAAETIPVAKRSPRMAEYYLRTSSMLNVQTQRGCALKCCYCTYPHLEGRRYRLRSPEAVVEELEHLEALGARYVFVVDSVFNTSNTHVAEICELILQRGLKLKWCCFLRPKRITRELMRLMARAGLTHIEFGSDSLSDPVLEAYGKGLTFADILESSEHAVAENIDYSHYLICGGPGETMQTLEETLENSRRLENAVIMARVGMRVYPGTPLFERLISERGARDTPDLLQPYYYLSPEVKESEVFARLRSALADMPNWIFDEPPASYYQLAERLRSKGVVGPLWSYFAMLQRLGNIMGEAS